MKTKPIVMTRIVNLVVATVVLLTLAVGCATGTKCTHGDPLPSWNDGPARQAIVEFVTKTTKAGSPDFVPLEERIATFDQDGTLWVEQPLYSFVMYALERVPILAKPPVAHKL